MASPLDSNDDNLEGKLHARESPQGVDVDLEEQNRRIRAQNERDQQHLADVVNANSTLPAFISNVTITNTRHTRQGFLKRIFDPLLGKPLTLGEAVRQLSAAQIKMSKFDIFHEPPGFVISGKPFDEKIGAAALDIIVSAREKGLYAFKAGADLGNTEGSTFGNCTLKNIFGGAEALTLGASWGTRTRSAYHAIFDTPILSNPDLHWQVGGLQSSTEKSWASHEEFLRGGWTKINWTGTPGNQHELSYNGQWRQITGLAPNASPTVRADAGDSFKSSLTYTFFSDHLDNRNLPSCGYLFKTTSELAGYGLLKGDVSFLKQEIHAKSAVPIPIPGFGRRSGITFATGFRAGVLYPLTASGDGGPKPSRLNDRFVLGGPTDVRGFRIGSLGPRDAADAAGGDVYAAGSANLLFPLPRLGPDSPLRFQIFASGGRLLALKYTRRSDKSSTIGSSDEVRSNMVDTIKKLGNGLPSIAAGVGLVYVHPVARFELNFSLPLVTRRNEGGRKGVSFGVGIDFL